jgi:hypothetical protein
MRLGICAVLPLCTKTLKALRHRREFGCKAILADILFLEQEAGCAKALANCVFAYPDSTLGFVEQSRHD